MQWEEKIEFTKTEQYLHKSIHNMCKSKISEYNLNKNVARSQKSFNLIFP